MPNYELRCSVHTTVIVNTDEKTLAFRGTTGMPAEQYSYTSKKEGLASFLVCPVCDKDHDLETEKGRSNAGWAFNRLQRIPCSTECGTKAYIQRHACCEKAEPIFCVCQASFKCPEHGEQHIGTHD